MHDLPTLILFIACFLLLISAIEHYARHWIIPPVGWTLLAGVIYGFAANASATAASTGFTLPQITLSHGVIFYVFLPILLFGSARRLQLNDLITVGPAVGILSTVGLVIAAGVTGLGCMWLLEIPFLDAMLFAAAVSAVDPIAIAAVLERFKLPERLRTLIEGESMVNDGTTIVLFSVIYAHVFNERAFITDHPILGLLLVIIGSGVMGIVIGYLGFRLLRHWREIHNQMLGVIVPLALMLIIFAIAEHIHLSGVIAVMAATLTMCSLHARRDRDAANDDGDDTDMFFDRFWVFLSTLANATLFFGLGALIGDHQWHLAWWWLPLLVFMLWLGRAAGVYLGALPLLPSRHRIPWSWQHLLNIAGLKGAVTIALLLILPEDYIHRDTFICAAFILIGITLVLHPIIARWYLQRTDLG